MREFEKSAGDAAPDHQTEVIRPHEAAKCLGVTVETLLLWTREHRLPHIVHAEKVIAYKWPLISEHISERGLR